MSVLVDSGPDDPLLSVTGVSPVAEGSQNTVKYIRKYTNNLHGVGVKPQSTRTKVEVSDAWPSRELRAERT